MLAFFQPISTRLKWSPLYSTNTIHVLQFFFKNMLCPSDSLGKNITQCIILKYIIILTCYLAIAHSTKRIEQEFSEPQQEQWHSFKHDTFPAPDFTCQSCTERDLDACWWQQVYIPTAHELRHTSHILLHVSICSTRSPHELQLCELYSSIVNAG